jgi:hypothetical protein
MSVSMRMHPHLSAHLADVEHLDLRILHSHHVQVVDRNLADFWLDLQRKNRMPSHTGTESLKCISYRPRN